jgi:MFS family permease
MASSQQKVSLVPVVLLALSAVLSGAGFGIYGPAIAVHAAELGAPTAIATAMIMAFPSIISVIILLPAGIYADKTGKRKEVVMIGLILGTVFNILLGLARSWVELVIYRTIGGIVFAFGSLFMAMGALIAPERIRGTILGVLAGSMMLGMGASQVIAGLIPGLTPQTLYFTGATLTFLSLLLLLPVKVPRVQLPAMKMSDIATALKARGVYWTAIAICIYLIGWNFMYPSLSIVLQYIYSAPAWIQFIGMGVASIMLGVGTYIWGPIVDKWGGRRTLIFAILASAIVTFIMYPALGSMWAYTVLFWVVTFFGVVGMPGTSYVASRSVRPELVSVAITTMFIAISIASIVGGFVGGVVLGLGLDKLILIAATIELIGGILMFGLPKV